MQQFVRRLWSALRWRRLQADLAEEMDFHRDTARRELERAGREPSEASTTARRAFGSATWAMDGARDVWIPVALREVSHDVRFAFRLFVKNPSFAIVAVVSLALSIGFNTTLFTIVDGMAGGTPRVEAQQRVVTLGSLDQAGRPVDVSYLDFQDWRRTSRSFEGLAAFATAAMTLTDQDLAAERVSGAYISAATFSLLRERPILGRDFQPSDDGPAAERVAIIAASVWKGRYGGAPGIIGRGITVNGASVTVVGVMREGFRFPLVHDLWQPLSALPGLEGQPRDSRGLRVFGRLAPGVNLTKARSDLAVIASGLSNDYPATNANVRPRVDPFSSGFDLANPWNAMLVAVGIVLLIACANIANLLLAHATYRSNEIAIRMSLGASRWRIVRQLLIESALLAGLAGLGGVGIAMLGVRAWLASMPVADWPYWYHFEVNARVLLYLAAISLSSLLLFGVGPAWYVSGTYPSEHLKDAGRNTAGRRTRRWSNALLGAELALTLSLLAGAGLLARTFIAVYRADSIVDTSPVILAGLGLTPQKYRTPAQRIALYSELEARAGAIPSVEAAVVASGAPFYNAPVWSVTLQGQGSSPTSVSPTTSYVHIGSRYFDTLGLRLLRGRAFTDLDGTPGHETAIVNQLFASTYLPGLDAIGRRIRLADPRKPDPNGPWLLIVGVSPTVREHYPPQEFDPVVYVPYRLNPLAGMTLMARSRSGAAVLAPALREQLRQLDPDLPLLNIRPLDWLLSGTRFANQVFATLFAIAAALGLLLAAVGLHAVIAHDVSRRTQEIGVRMALGAQPRQVVWMFVRGVMAPVAWGFAVGLVGAFAVGRFVRGMLIQTSPSDPVTLVSILIVLALVALTSAFRPARRATRLDPVSALRYE